MRIPGRVGAAFLTIALLGSGAVMAAGPSVTLPTFVIKDGNGDVIGPISNINNSGEPTFSVSDPTFGNAIVLKARWDSLIPAIYLQGQENTVFYQNAGCGGQVYIRPPNSSLTPVSRLLGRSYGVGKGTGGAQFVFRSNGPDKLGTNPTVRAQWSGGQCTDFPMSSTAFELIQATEIININNAFPPPYTLE